MVAIYVCGQFITSRLTSLVKEVAVFGAVVEFFHHGVVCWEEDGAKNDK